MLKVQFRSTIFSGTWIYILGWSRYVPSLGAKCLGHPGSFCIELCLAAKGHDLLAVFQTMGLYHE